MSAWARSVSLVAQTGLQFDLRTAQGKLIASLMAALAEFERGFAPRARARALGYRRSTQAGRLVWSVTGSAVKADRSDAPRVLALVGAGQSYREISHRFGISKNTVPDNVKRARTA